MALISLAESFRESRADSNEEPNVIAAIREYDASGDRRREEIRPIEASFIPENVISIDQFFIRAMTRASLALRYFDARLRIYMYMRLSHDRTILEYYSHELFSYI